MCYQTDALPAVPRSNALPVGLTTYPSLPPLSGVRPDAFVTLWQCSGKVESPEEGTEEKERVRDALQQQVG